jgi:DNA-binding transcriptional LysR family regulator
MEFQALRAFVEVVRQKGFSRAASQIFSTQSTISKVVKQLEHEIGVPLLNRANRQVTLTEVGEIVYRHALRILAKRDELVTELSDVRDLKFGRLRLGLPPVNTSAIFAPILGLYRNRYPGIEISLVEQGGEILKEKLLSCEIDLAVALLPLSTDFAWQEITREPLVAVLPAGHPLEDRETVDLASLQRLPFILFEFGYSISRVVLDACKQRGIEPTIAARSCQVELIIELAVSGLGVGFLPRLVAEQRSVKYVRLAEPGTEWHLAMAWRRASYLSNAAKAWLDLLVESSNVAAVKRHNKSSASPSPFRLVAS